MKALIQPVILSGGSGTRLWPLSRDAKPKQFATLVGETSMFQQAIARVSDPDLFSAPLIVGSARHQSGIANQLAELAVSPVGVILEPAGRNTAPAVALAALRVPTDTILLVMPSDHAIDDPAGFRQAASHALRAAEQGCLVAFGITPDRPETGYGYIQMGEAIDGIVRKAARFVEKPDKATAARLLAQGGWCWNAGIFLFRSGDYLAALAAHAPDVLAACEAAVGRGTIQEQAFKPDEKAFLGAPSISIDYAVMERASDVAVVPLNIGWSDVGSWDALYDLSAKDVDRNSADDGALQIDSRGCLVRSDGARIVTVGVEDLIVVATDGDVLVMRRGESQRVREVVAALKQKGDV